MWVENGKVIAKVSGSAPCLRRSATTRANASAVAIGSNRSPSRCAISAACSAGDTVMALPLMPRLKGAAIGTFTWPMPRLEAIATGASRCAASNSPILSLSRTFDHETSRTKVDIEAFGRGEAVVDGDDQCGGIDQRNETDAKRARHFRISDAVRIDCAISPIFFFSRIAVERIRT